MRISILNFAETFAAPSHRMSAIRVWSATASKYLENYEKKVVQTMNWAPQAGNGLEDMLSPTMLKVVRWVCKLCTLKVA